VTGREVLTPAPVDSVPTPPERRERGPLSIEHRIAIGATMAGVTRDEYRRHVAAGEKWCAGHHDWHPRNANIFYSRPANPDGLDNVCKEIVRGRCRTIMSRRRASAVTRDGQGRSEAVS
jgi:hypothetical protein